MEVNRQIAMHGRAIRKEATFTAEQRANILNNRQAAVDSTRQLAEKMRSGGAREKLERWTVKPFRMRHTTEIGGVQGGGET